MTRRIAFIVSSLHGGGAEAVGLAWMQWFVQHGWTVSAVVVSAKPVDLVPDGVRVLYLGDVRGHAAKAKKLAAGIRESRYDVLVGLQTYPNLIQLAAVGLVPKQVRPLSVISEHNLISLGLRGASRSHRLKIAIAKRSYRFADRVVSVSHPVAAEMVSAFGVRGNRSAVVPNPAGAKIDRAARRGPIDESSTGPLQIVLACRLVEQKRPQLAIHAARTLMDRGKDVEVLSFGGGPLLEETQSLAMELGVPFHHLGWVEDWFASFGPNAVVFLPSHREGFGNVLVEAAASGYPSVAISSALGVADAIIPGVTGALAIDSEPDSIADAILTASRITVPDISTWLDRFTTAGSAGTLQHIIDQGLGAPRAAA